MSPRPSSLSCPICQTRFGPGSCIHISGKGTYDDPYTAVPIHDDDADQLLESGPAGWGAFAPSWLLDPPACHVYSTVSTSMPFDVAQGIFFTDVRYDTDGMWDEENSRIIFKTAGVYLVQLNVRWQKKDVSEGDVSALIRVNGGEFVAGDSVPYGGADLYNSHSVVLQDKFAAGDFVQAFAKQDGVSPDGEDQLTGIILTQHRMPSFAATFLRPYPS